jgi:hypothetical protein
MNIQAQVFHCYRKPKEGYLINPNQKQKQAEYDIGPWSSTL